MVRGAKGKRCTSVRACAYVRVRACACACACICVCVFALGETNRLFAPWCLQMELIAQCAEQLQIDAAEAWRRFLGELVDSCPTQTALC